MLGFSDVAAGAAAVVGRLRLLLSELGGFRSQYYNGTYWKWGNDASEGETPLIRGLPDDVAILCLARVPKAYHADLKFVSKRWRELVRGEELRIIRKKYNIEETWIYALCSNECHEPSGIPECCCYVLDPYGSRRWKRTEDLPPRIVQRQYMDLQVLGQKAYLFGGRDYTEREWNEGYTGDDEVRKLSDEVYCYDGTTDSWSQAAPLPTPRCYSNSIVLDGKIYADDSNSRNTWEAYDPITNIWNVLSKPQIHMNSHSSTHPIVYNEKLYVKDSCKPGIRGAVFDPSTRIWHDADNDFASGWHGKSVVLGGRLYAYNLGSNPSTEALEFKLRRWDEDRKEWMSVVELSSDVMTPRISVYDRVVGIGKSIFFVGDKLLTTELDVNNVEKGGEPYLSDVARPIWQGFSPLICKCITV